VVEDIESIQGWPRVDEFGKQRTQFAGLAWLSQSIASCAVSSSLFHPCQRGAPCYEY